MIVFGISIDFPDSSPPISKPSDIDSISTEVLPSKTTYGLRVKSPQNEFSSDGSGSKLVKIIPFILGGSLVKLILFV
nr:MAG TPA: hypothetical protein [Caudoviricetes sp.]